MDKSKDREGQRPESKERLPGIPGAEPDYWHTDERLRDWIDPRYPVLMASVDGAAVRLAKDVERRLIVDAMRGGETYRSIRTWEDYLSATLVACATKEEALRKERAAERLLAALEQWPGPSEPVG